MLLFAHSNSIDLKDLDTRNSWRRWECVRIQVDVPLLEKFGRAWPCLRTLDLDLYRAPTNMLTGMHAMTALEGLTVQLHPNSAPFDPYAASAWDSQLLQLPQLKCLKSLAYTFPIMMSTRRRLERRVRQQFPGLASVTISNNHVYEGDGFDECESGCTPVDRDDDDDDDGSEYSWGYEP